MASAKYSPICNVAPEAGAPASAAMRTQSDGDSSVAQEKEWASAGQNLAACNRTEKIVEEKERRLLESIQRNYGRIKEVERELGALQLQLRVNVGPKKQALELLRRKIEAQNERVKAATARRDAAKKAFDEAAEALAGEERAKEQLCAELNLLVQQSAHAQLDKLDQLTRRLEMLNSGMTLVEEAEAASRLADGGQPSNAAHLAAAVQQGADTLRNQILAAATGAAAQAQPQQQGGPGGAGAFDASNPFLAQDGAPAQQQQQQQQQQPQQQDAAPEQQRQKAEAERARQRAEAEAARARHVAVGRAGPARSASQQRQQRGPGPAAGRGEGAGGRPRAATASAEAGPFRGFD